METTYVSTKRRMDEYSIIYAEDRILCSSENKLVIPISIWLDLKNSTELKSILYDNILHLNI